MQGPFETHLTLSAACPADFDELTALVAEAALKLTCIELAHGLHPLQPMVTRHGAGSLATEFKAIAELKAQFHDLGWRVVRTKIEVDAGHAAAPLNAGQAADCPAERYFENHVKILHAPDIPMAAMVSIAGEVASRLSRNARRIRPDGGHERFFTQRFYRSPRSVARHGLEVLLHRLAAAGFTVLEHEEEYVIHDTNIALDAGWLEPGEYHPHETPEAAQAYSGVYRFPPKACRVATAVSGAAATIAQEPAAVGERLSSDDREKAKAE